MEAWPPNQMNNGRDQGDDKYGQDEEVEERIATGVMGKTLGVLSGIGKGSLIMDLIIVARMEIEGTDFRRNKADLLHSDHALERLDQRQFDEACLAV